MDVEVSHMVEQDGRVVKGDGPWKGTLDDEHDDDEDSLAEGRVRQEARSIEPGMQRRDDR